MRIWSLSSSRRRRTEMMYADLTHLTKAWSMKSYRIEILSFSNDLCSLMAMTSNNRSRGSSSNNQCCWCTSKRNVRFSLIQCSLQGCKEYVWGNRVKSVAQMRIDINRDTFRFRFRKRSHLHLQLGIEWKERASDRSNEKHEAICIERWQRATKFCKIHMKVQQFVLDGIWREQDKIRKKRPGLPSF